MGDLTSVWDLRLNNNQLSGTIPTELGDLSSLVILNLHDNPMLGVGTALIEKMETLSTTDGSLEEFGLWGNDDLTGAARGVTDDLGKRIDRAALRAVYEGNDAENWKNKDGWLPLPPNDLFAFSEWYGVSANSDGRVSELNLGFNDLSKDVPTSFEALNDLEKLDLSYNNMLTGELTPRLSGLTTLTELNIRCTMIDTPAAMEFQDWLDMITFVGMQSGDRCVAPPPGEVTGLTVTAGELSLVVSWTQVTDAIGYRVQWKSGMQDFNTNDRQHTVGGHITTYTIPNLEAGTEYTVRVRAVFSGSPDPSLPVEETGTPITPQPPGPVQGATVTAGVLSLSVSWTQVTDADGYKVQWISGSENFLNNPNEQVITGGSTTTYTIPNLTAGTEYTVIVIATKSGALTGRRQCRKWARRFLSRLRDR